MYMLRNRNGLPGQRKWTNVTIDTGEPGLETWSHDPNSLVTTVTGSYPARHANTMATSKVV